MRLVVPLMCLFITLKASADPVRIVSAGPAGIEVFEQVKREIDKSLKLETTKSTFKRGAAVNSLIAGQTDGVILASSPEEMFKDPEKNEVPKIKLEDYQYLQFAKTKVNFFVHPDNPVKSLSAAQVAGLFSGKEREWKNITNWPAPVKTIGSKNLKSTTTATCKHYLKKEECHFDEIVVDQIGVLRALQKSPGGISFMGGETTVPGFQPKILPSDVELPMYLLKIKRTLAQRP